MSEREDIRQVVRILKRVPPKSLRIVELLNQIPVKHGTDMLEKLGAEIEEAKKEAEAYRHATQEATNALMRLQSKDEWEA